MPARHRNTVAQRCRARERARENHVYDELEENPDDALLRAVANAHGAPKLSMNDAARIVQKAHRANSGRIAPAPIEAHVVEAHVVEARVVEARVVEARVVAVAPGPEPTLTERCAFLKEQLGLEGSIPAVIAGACRALGLDEAGTLVERARRCRAAVGGGLPSAGAAPSAPPSHRGGGAPIHCEVLRDDSARKLQGLQRQRIARAKAQEARVLKVQRAARAQIQTAAAGGVAGQRLKSVLVLGSPLPLCDGAYRRDEKGKNLTGAANGKGDDGTQYVSIRKGPRGGRWCILREGGRWHLKGGAGVTRYHFDSTADAPPIGQWLVTTHVGRPAPSVSHTGFFGEVVRDDSARKLQGLQRQRIARAKAQEARVLRVQRAARAQMQDRKVVVAPPCDKKLFVLEPEHRTYEEHERRAAARGMVLATIASPEENLDARFPLNKQTAFIGAIRHGTGTGPGAKHWRWADGAAWGYANWARGEVFLGTNRARKQFKGNATQLTNRAMASVYFHMGVSSMVTFLCLEVARFGGLALTFGGFAVLLGAGYVAAEDHTARLEGQPEPPPPAPQQQGLA